MITLLIKSYLTLLLCIGLGSLFILIVGFYLIFRLPASKKLIKTQSLQQQNEIDSHDAVSMETDITAIAGDDIIATQLDLARAYIETDQNELAKKILEYVAEKGKMSQQNEARELLSSL